jgi:gluconate kinase
LLKANKVLIFGAAGSGSSTIAKTIAHEYGHHWIEVDEALFMPTDPPFSVRRSLDEVRNIVFESWSKAESVIVCGSIVGWGDELKQAFDLVIFVHVDVDVRIQRIKHREAKRFGSRVLEGGDMHRQHLEFLDWVRAYDFGGPEVRSLAQHRQWLKDVAAPIVEVLTDEPIDAIMTRLRPYLEEEDDDSSSL